MSSTPIDVSPHAIGGAADRDLGMSSTAISHHEQPLVVPQSGQT
jgi:hypothetical protein